MARRRHLHRPGRPHRAGDLPFDLPQARRAQALNPCELVSARELVLRHALFTVAGRRRTKRSRPLSVFDSAPSVTRSRCAVSGCLARASSPASRTSAPTASRSVHAFARSRRLPRRHLLLPDRDGRRLVLVARRLPEIAARRRLLWGSCQHALAFRGAISHQVRPQPVHRAGIIKASTITMPTIVCD